MPEVAAARGYACLVSSSHAVELHDLPESLATAFMRDARTVSRALAEATGAVKLNYEIHGNTLPHLHMHFYPRYPGDRFERGPIDPKAVAPPVYAEGEFPVLRNAIAGALARIVATSQST
jgi:diadenosine tetraphosphate (Ap4A) HIT family hydrolase